MGKIKEEIKDDQKALELEKHKVKRPSMYRVVLLNDDYTPMDFVVEVLRVFFNMDSEQANQIMLTIHYKGKGSCGIFTAEVAETKVYQVMNCAKENQHPLMCTMEKV